MKILCCGPDEIVQNLKSNHSEVTWIQTALQNIQVHIHDADAFFDLFETNPEFDYSDIKIPVFINAVTKPLTEIRHNGQTVRICGWNGFLERGTWEVAGNLTEAHRSVMDALHKKPVLVEDLPGLVAPRIISMIVNEAYFTRNEQVSTEKEIDIAMKLGTNYPKGPFEWKNEIGIRPIADLLLKLTETDTRYTPSELLIKEANQS